MLKAVRHALTGMGGVLAGLGWDTSWITGSIGVAAFLTGVALSVLDAYIVDDKIKAAGAW